MQVPWRTQGISDHVSACSCRGQAGSGHVSSDACRRQIEAILCACICRGQMGTVAMRVCMSTQVRLHTGHRYRHPLSTEWVMSVCKGRFLQRPAQELGMQRKDGSGHRNAVSLRRQMGQWALVQVPYEDRSFQWAWKCRSLQRTEDSS